MSSAALLQFLVLLAVLAITVPPLGRYIAKVFGSEPDGRAPGDRVFVPVERVVYRIMRVDPEREQRWSGYAMSMIAFSMVASVVLYGIMRLQEHFPLNPTHVGAVPAHLSFDTAVSFVTNTNWQSYGGENTMSYFTSMAGLLVQHFASAAVGLAVVIALIRGLARTRSPFIGNFWVDIVRGTTRILLPLSVLFAILLGSQGVIANFHGFRAVTIDGGRQAAHPGRPAGGMDGDQAVGEQRRRLLQRELGAPVREPHAALELPRALPHGRARVRPRGGLRDPRQGQASGPARRLDHGDPLDRRVAVRQLRRDQRQPPPHRGRCEPVDHRRPGRRQHGGQGGPRRRVVVRHLGRLGHADVERLRELHARQLDTRRARSCPSSAC